MIYMLPGNHRWLQHSDSAEIKRKKNISYDILYEQSKMFDSGDVAVLLVTNFTTSDEERTLIHLLSRFLITFFSSSLRQNCFTFILPFPGANYASFSSFIWKTRRILRGSLAEVRRVIFRSVAAFHLF